MSDEPVAQHFLVALEVHLRAEPSLTSDLLERVRALSASDRNGVVVTNARVDWCCYESLELFLIGLGYGVRLSENLLGARVVLGLPQIEQLLVAVAALKRDICVELTEFVMGVPEAHRNAKQLEAQHMQKCDRLAVELQAVLLAAAEHVRGQHGAAGSVGSSFFRMLAMSGLPRDGLVDMGDALVGVRG